MHSPRKGLQAGDAEGVANHTNHTKVKEEKVRILTTDYTDYTEKSLYS